MDRIAEAATIIKILNEYRGKEIDDPYFISKVCNYFDKIKDLDLSSSDMKFLRYLSNSCGVPHYYDLLIKKFGHEDDINDFDLNTLSASIYESTLHIDEKIKVHKYQKKILDKFDINNKNRFFLSATTSFGKTFLIYELIKNLEYKNIVLIFPTIALLSENHEKLMLSSEYKYFNNNFAIHTLSDINKIKEKNIFIFTPERYLSFIDKNKAINFDFAFVDEIYKIDNEFMIDSLNIENERDTAYRVALQDILIKCKDILLVGPYIQFPKIDDFSANQSFNIFLNHNEFTVIDFNRYEMVNKSNTLIGNRKIVIDDNLTIDLKGYSGKKIEERIAKIVYDVRSADENMILYSKGPGMAERYAKYIINHNANSKLSTKLSLFIEHLLKSYKYDNWVVIESLIKKVGIHHGLVPKYIQKEIIDLFNNGDIDILISTTTITEGVNTSAKNLLVLNSTKGNKILKKFDAKNVAGRAGRFLHHYSGRVLVLDKKFNEIINGDDDEIKHKNFDQNSNKNEIDYFITEEPFLNDSDKLNRDAILFELKKRGIPDNIIGMYKVISYSDKLKVFDGICEISDNDFSKINKLISLLNYNLTIDFDGLKAIFRVIKPIILNKDLKFLIETESMVKNGNNKGEYYPILVYLLSFYLKDGFIGSVDYNLRRKKDDEKYTVDNAIRETSKFVFNTLKYQLVKYLGVFNLMYKYFYTTKNHVDFNEVIGIDKLLVKLEYNAISEKGRLASDYGVPNKVVEYYDNGEIESFAREFDEYEHAKFKLVESILNKNSN
ncbi:TPA: helicase-related protein [Providencia alcalifaciens]